MTESSLEYDFGGAREESTNRFLCSRCKRTVYYTVKAVSDVGGVIKI